MLLTSAKPSAKRHSAMVDVPHLRTLTLLPEPIHIALGLDGAQVLVLPTREAGHMALQVDERSAILLRDALDRLMAAFGRPQGRA